jgi:hypothetical protein
MQDEDVYFESAMMKDFVSIDIESRLSNDDVYLILSSGLSEFSWRRGDSDMQGPYVSGRDANSVTIQCWTGENPMQMSVSFRGVKDVSQSEQEQLIKKLLNDLVPQIGKTKKNDN